VNYRKYRGNVERLKNFGGPFFDQYLKLIDENCYEKERIPEFLSLYDLFDVTNSKIFIHLYTKLFCKTSSSFMAGFWGTINEFSKGVRKKGLGLISYPVTELSQAERLVKNNALKFQDFAQTYFPLHRDIKMTEKPSAEKKSRSSHRVIESKTGVVYKDFQHNGKFIWQEQSRALSYTENVKFYTLRLSTLKRSSVILTMNQKEIAHLMLEELAGKHIPPLGTDWDRPLFFILASGWWPEAKLLRRIELGNHFPQLVTKEHYLDFFKRISTGSLLAWGWVLVKNHQGKIRLCWIKPDKKNFNALVNREVQKKED
jgi:hypothetical protein